MSNFFEMMCAKNYKDRPTFHGVIQKINVV